LVSKWLSIRAMICLSEIKKPAFSGPVGVAGD
jgi:hypothetical protein